uniref:cytochrome c oxidase subunit III n=1 Tax=Elthusa poutassouiensis TaxID=3104314 RepID=UPI002E780AE6|nr:cytochrome c oxidase subunit III [Elthusa poutassouiensis]WPS93547.1 cytochrome c oxidase subunit III [Elthusa poutassouiensis]
MMKMFHPYHLVDLSPWPLTSIFSALFLTSSLVYWFQGLSPIFILLPLMSMILSMVQWWRDIVREGTYQGLHTKKVQTGLKWGMILFITSEIMFFFSFFWAFFHSSLAPTYELGLVWPPTGITPLSFIEVPLLNTIVLLTSGMSVTWAHHSLIENNHPQSLMGLTLTVGLGFYFTFLQTLEYYEATFTLADSIYGSTFFVATGFHGFHVIIGSLFLTVCVARLYSAHFSKTHHLGFEAAAWYWHFVDVVWLFLFTVVYWWGS